MNNVFLHPHHLNTIQRLTSRSHEIRFEDNVPANHDDDDDERGTKLTRQDRRHRYNHYRQKKPGEIFDCGRETSFIHTAHDLQIVACTCLLGDCWPISKVQMHQQAISWWAFTFRKYDVSGLHLSRLWLSPFMNNCWIIGILYSYRKMKVYCVWYSYCRDPSFIIY